MLRDLRQSRIRPTTFNFQGRTRVGTVGVPIPGVEVKIAEDGEIQYEDQTFSKATEDEAATQATMRDGWLVW